jgi:hypothetical protein
MKVVLMPAVLRRLASIRLLAAALILGALAPAHGADRAAVARVLEAGGMRQVLASLSGAVDAAEANPPSGMPGRLPDMMRARFDAGEMFAEMTASVARLLTDDDVSAFAAFLASPLGRRVTEAEIAHAEITDPGQIMDDLERLANEDRRRIDQIDRMDEALHLTGIAMSISRTVMRAMITGMFGAQGDIDIPPQDLDALVARLTADRAETTRRAVHAGAAGAYGSISHADFDAYLDFLETPEAGAVYGAMLGSLRGMLKVRAGLLGRDIADAAQRREL